MTRSCSSCCRYSTRTNPYLFLKVELSGNRGKHGTGSRMWQVLSSLGIGMWKETGVKTAETGVSPSGQPDLWPTLHSLLSTLNDGSVCNWPWFLLSLSCCLNLFVFYQTDPDFLLLPPDGPSPSGARVFLQFLTYLTLLIIPLHLKQIHCSFQTPLFHRLVLLCPSATPFLSAAMSWSLGDSGGYWGSLVWVLVLASHLRAGSRWTCYELLFVSSLSSVKWNRNEQ